MNASVAPHTYRERSPPACKGYHVTKHAQHRLRQRRVGASELAAALAGKRVEVGDSVYYYNKDSHLVVVATDTRFILTVFRAKKNWIKKQLSR